MSDKKSVLALACAPVLLVVLIFVAVLGGGGANSAKATSFKGHVLGGTDLKREAVPEWAYQPLLAAAKTCLEITAPILAAQDETESNWNPNAYNAGSQATGLSQFIPSTWAAWGMDGDGDGKADPRNPADAIPSQAAYMCHLIDFVKGDSGLNGEIVDLALAAYNAGPGNVQKFGGIPPFQETTNYVTKIRALAGTKYSNPKPVAPGAAGVVIQKANEHVGKTMYSWGGGTLDGPGGGMSPDEGVIGFDCSSLVRYAYYQGTGHVITLPRVAQAQYDATKSHPVAVDEIQPGDLLFWGVVGDLRHVALAIGGNRMIEAPQSGQSITESDLRLGGDFAGATRVFGGPLDPSTRA